MQKPVFYQVMERKVLPSGAWADKKPKATIDMELRVEHKNDLVNAWVQTLWTERNRQTWAPDFLVAFEVYWSETKIRTCKDPEMNFETGTSWVTLALDMYLSTGVRPPAAHGGRRGLGTVKAWAKSIETLWKETRWKDPERREEERGRITNNVRDLGFAGLKACGGLRDQVCIHQTGRVATEILDWSRRARAHHGRKKEIIPQSLDFLPLTLLLRTCLAERTQTATRQPRKQLKQGQMQRVARIKHRCRQHNRETTADNKRHLVTVEREHMRCLMCAQTKPVDKVTIFLTQHCPATDQTNWKLRFQQLKSEMDMDQQERAPRDLRSLMGLQATTLGQRDRMGYEPPRRAAKRATESRKPNLGSTKREIETAQKRQDRLKRRAKLHNRGLMEERDFHWILVNEELLRCEFCGKAKVLDKATVTFQQRCMSAKQEGWWERICEKRNKDRTDDDSEQDEARVSRNLFALFEQSAQTEAKRSREMEAGATANKEREDQMQERHDAEQKEPEQKQTGQDTTTLKGLPEATPLPSTLTAQTTRQRTEWIGLFRRLMSAAPGLKKATEEDMHSDGTAEKSRTEQCSNAPVSRSLGHSGGDAVDSAGHSSAKDWWRMAHPSFSDGDDGSRQRAWARRWRTCGLSWCRRLGRRVRRGQTTRWGLQKVKPGCTGLLQTTPIQSRNCRFH